MLGRHLAAAALLTGLAATPAAARPQAPPPPPGSVTIAWVGDTIIGTRTYGLPPDGGASALDAVAPMLKKASIAFGNLEETLSVGGASKCGASASGSCFAFQGLPSYANVLARDGFDVMNVANNHAADYGADAERQTIAALRKAGIGPTGMPGAMSMRTFDGTRVAFLGFAPYRWASNLLDIPGARSMVKKAASMADLVVVAIHAGAEGSGATHVPHGSETFLGENRGNSRAFAHAVIDAGADLVVGSGPHVIRGVEAYHGKLIAYSLGNFAGYHTFASSYMTSLSGLLTVTIAGDGSYVSGHWQALRLVGVGVPQPDGTNASLTLVRTLSREDFAGRAARFDAAGNIRLPGGS
jgi:hypothetical protein